MKKLKCLVAFLLSLTFLSPLATLQACNNESSFSAGNGSVLDNEANGDTDDEHDSEENGDFDDENTGDTDDTGNTGDTDSGNNDDGSNGGDAGTTDTPVPDTPTTPSTPSKPTTPNTPSTPTTPTVQAAQYVRCTGNSVNLRSGAGTDYTVLGTAEKNTSYAVIGKSGSWYKTYYRGKTAYIYASYTAVFTVEKSADENVEKVIAEGYKLIGVPYVYGAVRFHDGKGKLLKGFSEQKFDCSSLVQYIFYKGAGKLLDVNTRTQIKQGTYVSAKNIKRGDLLFFTNDSREHLTGIERVGHVALYLGNNYILHTASDYARIEKISASRWDHYIEARRFF